MQTDRIFLVLLFLNVPVVLRLAAQTNTGEISGTVYDESGGVFPQVEVVVENQNTTAARTTHTDSAGRYSVALLPPGTYKVSAKLTGFQTEVQQGIGVSVGHEVVANLSLKVGAISSEATVNAETDLIDTRTAELSGLMSNQFIRELPLNGRDVYQLALLEPGVVMLRRTTDSGGSGTRLVVNGSRPSQNSFLLDGLQARSRPPWSADARENYGRISRSGTQTITGENSLSKEWLVENCCVSRECFVGFS
jgi:hypothetical protein